MLIKFRGGNMGMASRPVLVDLSSDIPEPSRSAQLFKKALEKGKLTEGVLKNPIKDALKIGINHPIFRKGVQ